MVASLDMIKPAVKKHFSEEVGHGESHEPQLERVNILVVDDLPEKLLSYQVVLEELGQNIITARSGEEALKLLLTNDFAVILLDVNMPVMDGFETAALIRKRKRSARTPIIFLTGFTDEMDVAQGYATGAVDYLPTPVVPEVLKAKVKVFIELFQMRKQAALQAEERAKREAAEEADRRKDEFLGMLAHELRNPLGPIRNAAQVLYLMGNKDERFNQLRDIVDRQVTHMSRLIDDLLDATRLARGQILLRKERCNLSKIVCQTAEDYRSIFDASGIKLKIEMPSMPLWVNGDPTRLVQAIGNLLHNAHKFSDPGGLITVRLEQNGDGKTGIISVQDTGIGIDPKILPHVFEVFRQGDQGLDRSRGGLGLGLSLARGLVKLHKGEMSAESAGIGRGAKFHIKLPLESMADLVVEAGAEEQNLQGAKQRILLIEDNLDTAESTKLLLSLNGYDVQTAFTGAGGLKVAKDFRPQVILCDIGLPGMDGYQVVRAIRQDKELSSAYVIALTGYGRDEDQQQASAAGFDMHLTKPIDYNNLYRALAHLPA